MNKLFIFIIVAFLLSSCGADPRKDAAAYMTRLEADAQARDADQARVQVQAMNEIAIQDAERNQLVKDAGLQNAQKAAGWITYWGGLAVTVSVALMVLSVGAGASMAIVGGGKAMARAAMVKANTIYLDKSTGQYPLVLEYAGKGIMSLTDPNTNSTLLLDTRNEPDRMMIQTAGAVRHVGVLAAASSKSADPTGVAMVQPMIIDSVEA